MVEFAIVALFVFMVLFALFDLGTVEIGNSSGGNGAREGARVGILYPIGASTAGSSSNNAIVNAVQSKLAGLVRSPIVTVTCINGDDGVTTIACDTGVRPDRDRLRVTVTWTHKATSPFIKSSTKTESATMTIVGYAAAPSGLPTTTTSSNCQILSTSLNPTAVTIANGAASGPLSASFSLTVNTSGPCGQIWAFFTPGDPGSGQTSLLLTSSLSTYTSTIAASQLATWTTGAKGFYFAADSIGSAPYAAPATVLQVSTSSVCSVLTATVNPPTSNPPSVALASATEPSNLVPSSPSTAPSITVTATTTAACTKLYMSFITGAAGTSQDVPMTSTGATTFKYDIYSSTAPSYSWTSGLKTFSFDDGGLVTPPTVNPYSGPTASVQITPASQTCVLNVAFTSTTGAAIASVNVTKDGYGADLVTSFVVTATPSGSCGGSVYVRWDRGVGFSSSSPQALLVGNAYTINAGEGGYKSWALAGNVTFLFYNGVPSTTNQVATLSPATLQLVRV